MFARYLEVQGIRTRVKYVGEGQPVLFVHGNPDSADMWDGVISHLPQTGYRYLAIDLPGFGKASAADDFDFSIENRGTYLRDMLDALEITEPILLVAHDHGGPFAASFAVQYPQQVQALVLQNTIFHRGYQWHPFGVIWRTPLLGECFVFTQQIDWISKPLAYAYIKWGSPLMTRAHVDDIQRNYDMTLGRTILRIYRASDPEAFIGWDDRLEQFAQDKPIMILWGVHDKYIPMDWPKDMASKGAKLVTFDDAGHWLALTKAERYAQELTTFFEELNND